MKKYQSSRGWRNRNPLNIRQKEMWPQPQGERSLVTNDEQRLGLSERQTDREYCQFVKMCFGYMAAARVLKAYAEIFAREGIAWTVGNIVSHWTMHTGRDAVEYTRRVLQLMHRKADNQQLAPISSRPGRTQLAMLAAAMTCAETGCPPYAVPMGALRTGFAMEGLGEEKR